ncbi:MAG: hypothetical protein EOP54_08385 [Sphingobacteriales bacterium]|nr:MAG: hypothetical protein EOP54_08385 [Sphingobacteriales bacterium]
MGHSVGTEDNKSRAVTTKAAMFFALIIVGLLIATANFIQVMGHSEGHGAAHGTEAGHDAHGGGHDAHAAPAHGKEHAAPAAHTEDTSATADEGKAGANADTAHAEAVHGKGAAPAQH